MQKPEIEFNKNCSIRKAVAVLGLKWSILIFNELIKHQILRFGQLRAVLGNVNTRTLTASLKQMEKDGLIERRQYDEIPLRVEYSLTPKGRELKKVLSPLQTWYEKWY